MSHGLFVTGTDTGVGKTLVASTLVHLFAQQGLRSAGMKPVASGAIWEEGRWTNEDVLALTAAANVEVPLALVNPYLLKRATAPHIAAAEENITIDLSRLADCYQQITTLCDTVIVEGAGGFIIPFDDHHNSDDLVSKLNLPVILVVGIRLGCINHALLTQHAIQSRGLKLAGWVANDIDPNESCADGMVETLQKRLQAPLLGRLPWKPGMTVEQAASYFNPVAIGDMSLMSTHHD